MSATGTAEVRVELGERSYAIHIGTGLLDSVGRVCRELGLKGPAFLVSDAIVDGHHGPRCAAALAGAGYVVGRAVVPAGEESKSERVLFSLYEKAMDQGLDRRSFVVALGGGVVGDLAGFMAATFLRGLPLVQAPTTVVAMVDSAVGGKTGINLPRGKNLVGSFHQPVAVVADLDLLTTLPEREYLSGLAEVVKYGVIADADLFELLERQAGRLRMRDGALLRELVARSCAIKADVVRRDEREGGPRAALNFGHTLAHAVERVAGYGSWLHGEAVSAGLVYAARLSVKAGTGLTEADAGRLEALLVRLGLPVAPPPCPWADIRRAMSADKKAVGRAPRFVLAERLGAVRFGVEVAEPQLEEVWNVLRQ